jgi:membrane fusion protein (multidrug efflux system)
MLARTRAKFLIMAVFVGIIAFAVVEGLYWWRHVTVTSAWLGADFTVMGSGVNGRIERIEVQKGDTVKTGTLLATMDSEIAELDAVSLEADLAQERAQKTLVENELSAFQQDIRDQIETQETIIALQSRELETLMRRLRIAQSTMARNAKLIRRQVISRTTNDTSKDRELEITSELRELETTISEKQRKIAELKGMTAQEAIFRSRIEVIDRGIEKLEIGIQQSRRQLAKMHIYAPINAVVNDVYVNAGAYVEDGDRVFVLHDPAKLWIEAPVDDSQVRHVSLGQRVEIDIEAYPYVEFTGTVASVGQATVGSMTGNNDASRGAPKIPVRIALDQSDHPLWPGARATVHIRIR